MFLTLVVATVGRTEEIGRLIESLAEQSDKDFEVVLVDQNPDDRIARYISLGISRGLVIRHVRLPTKNLSGARNEGVRLARGDVVGFPDDDCWYDRHLVGALRALFSGNMDGVIGRWAEAYAQAGSASERDVTLATARIFRAGDTSSITLFLKTSVVVGLGGFDSRIGVGQWFGSGEETDLLLRILKAGGVLARSSQVIVHHAISADNGSARMDRRRRLRLRERGTGAIYAKHAISKGVVMRGLVGPFVRVLWGRPARTSLLDSLATTLGRLEGYLRWRLIYGRTNGG